MGLNVVPVWKFSISSYRHSPIEQQRVIVDILWKLWSRLPLYGRKAAQFVDLLGYFSIAKASPDGAAGSVAAAAAVVSDQEIQAHVQDAVTVLKSQNEILANHPNAAIYGSLAQLVQLNGY